jgi:2-amino-4-hydroxy-6-hydroxymethyldihydropteridine diphosphokinase
MLTLPPWAVVTPRRAEHIARVVELMAGWAKQRGAGAAEADRWRRAALFHDALKDADDEVLASYLPQGDWPGAVWHGPAAAEAAARHGEKDRGVLDAVRYHSLGYAGWDDVGKALYLADYLEPGRKHGRRIKALAARAPRALDDVLREVAAARIGHQATTGKPIRKETADFWNRLAKGASSSS